jgi:hypothetical protein
MREVATPLQQVVNASLKFEQQPLTFADGEIVYITRQTPYVFLYKNDGYWTVADR